MAEQNQEQGLAQVAAADAQPPAAAEPAAAPQAGQPKQFVPFFNEEYEFRLGSLGDTATAYRLGAIFILMLIGAVLMYLCAWWWVGTHPLAQNQ